MELRVVRGIKEAFYKFAHRRAQRKCGLWVNGGRQLREG